MKLPRKQAAFLREAIEQRKHDGLLADTQTPRLAETILVQPFDWRRLAKYSFWIALISIVSSVSAALSDQFLIDLLEDLPSMRLPPGSVSASCSWRLAFIRGVCGHEGRTPCRSIAMKRSSF